MKYLIFRKKQIADVLKEMGYENVRIGAGKGHIVVEMIDSMTTRDIEGIKNKILESFPDLELVIDEVKLLEEHKKFGKQTNQKILKKKKKDI